MFKFTKLKKIAPNELRMYVISKLQWQHALQQIINVINKMPNFPQ